MKKRLLATILSLCLLVGLLPTAALAAEMDGNILDVQEPSGEPGNVRELPTENAMCTYVTNGGTPSTEEVTLSAAVEALNAAGGGTITVVSTGLADKKNIQIDTPIIIVAQEEKPVVVTTTAMEEDDALFKINRYGAENSVLTLGQDGMSDGLLTFDGAGQANTCIVGNVAGNGDADEPHGVILQDGVVLTGCTFSAIASGSQRIPQVTMYGGQIKGNTGEYAVMGSPFTMTGGEICDNESKESTVYAPFWTSTTTIGGDAWIHDNEAGSYGGVHALGILILEDNAKITDCTGTDDSSVGGAAAANGLTLKDHALIESCNGMAAGGAMSSGDVTLSDYAAIRQCKATESAWENGKMAVANAGGVVCTGNATIGSFAEISDCEGGLTGGILCTGVLSYLGEEVAEVNIKGTIKDNSGAFGGGIAVMLGTNLTIDEGAVITGNHATAMGGGIALMNGADISQNEGGIEDYQKVTLTMNGGTISGNTAPKGGGVYVAGTADVLEFVGADSDDQPVPCYVNLSGGTITGNTATESGGGMFLGWDTESTIQGAVNISGNLDGTGAASDLYLRQDPDVPVSDPESGSTSSGIEGLKNFIQTSAKAYVEKEVWPDVAEKLENATDEEVKEALSELGISTEGQELTREELEQLLHETVLKVYSLQSQITKMETFIHLYRQEHAFVPTPEEFYPLWSGLMLEYYEVLLPIEIAGASEEDINEIAVAVGLIKEGENYTGTTEDLIDAYMKFLETQIPAVDSKDYLKDVYSEYWETPVSGGGADFPFDARLNVTGPLAGSRISVNVENPQQWRVIAEGTDSYTISDEDLAVFQSNDSPYQVARVDGNENLLVLAIEEDDPGTDPGTNPGGSTYPITVEDSRYGDVDSSRTRASSGSTITLTITPDEGYVLDELVVTDKSGNELRLTNKGDGRYTFTMPRSAVTVEATFRAEEPATPAWDECGRGPDCPAYHFTDLDLSLWYHDGIHFCVEHGLMVGTGMDTFAPNTTTSRGMIVTILWRMAGSPDMEDKIWGYPFADVDATAYYGTAVYWARLNGIAGGYDDATFGPNDPITREQMAAILYRYAQYKGYDVSAKADLNKFTDADEISNYALEALQWANAEGLINGKGDGVLDPKGQAPRAEAAVILMRFCENYATTK